MWCPKDNAINSGAGNTLFPREEASNGEIVIATTGKVIGVFDSWRAQYGHTSPGKLLPE